MVLRRKRRRRVISLRSLVIVLIIGLISIIWIQITDHQNSIKIIENSNQDSVQIAAIELSFVEDTNIKKRNANLKYILLWTKVKLIPLLYDFKKDSIEVMDNTNCYFTMDRFYFDGDLTQFDGIIFDNNNITDINSEVLVPNKRSVKQYYIFYCLESANNNPVCKKNYDDFFNTTATYRLDSDIPLPYFIIKNKDGEVVGPKQDMEWVTDVTETEENDKWQNKSKAVAWFVSQCSSKSGRESYAHNLKKYLSALDLKLDIYGNCGRLKCPEFGENSCNDILERDYFFYLSFEDSFAEDYITDNLLIALENNAVPIVFGGADYNRFLPPGSYLDANTNSPQETAAKINSSINTAGEYAKFHRWRSHYSYHKPLLKNYIHAICDALSNRTLREKYSSYKYFRRWWNPKYKDICPT